MKSLLLTSLLATVLTLATTDAKPADLGKMPLAELQAKSAEGEPAAIFELAKRLANGTGLPMDHKAANELFLKAGDLGKGMGYYKLGYNYANGIGVTKDVVKANELFKKAADLGFRDTRQPNMEFDTAK